MPSWKPSVVGGSGWEISHFIAKPVASISSVLDCRLKQCQRPSPSSGPFLFSLFFSEVI